MEDFLLQCDEITSFEENLVESDASIYNYSAIEAEIAELQKLWSERKGHVQNMYRGPRMYEEE